MFGLMLKARFRMFAHRQRSGQALRYNSGQAALTLVIFFLVVMLAVIFGFSRVALTEAAMVRELVNSKKSYAAAESGVEDMLYRMKNPSMVVDDVEALSVGGVGVTTTRTDTGGGSFELNSVANADRAIRKAKVTVSEIIGASFYYGMQVGYLGLEMSNSAAVKGNVFSNGSINRTGVSGQPRITGGVFVADGIAGTADAKAKFPLPQCLNLINDDGVGGTDASDADCYNPSYNPFGKDEGSAAAGLVPHEVHKQRDILWRKFLAQSFVSSVTAEPFEIKLLGRKCGNPTSGGNIKIFSYGDGEFLNTGIVIANASFDENDFNLANCADANDGWRVISKNFTTTGPINADTPYWLVISSSYYDSGKYYEWAGGDGGDAGAGDNYIQYVGATPYGKIRYTQDVDWRLFDNEGYFQPQDPGDDIFFELFMGEESASTKIQDIIIGEDCADGLDNDGDGLIDLADTAGCASATDLDETDGSAPNACPDEAHAHKIINVNLYANAYVDPGGRTGGSLDPKCTENPYTTVLPADPPITDAQEQAWVDEATAGGNCQNLSWCSPYLDVNGNFILSGTVPTDPVVFQGPVKISGDFTVQNQRKLTIGGAVYVTGAILIQDYAEIRVDESFGEKSGVIISDGTVEVLNRSGLFGTSDPKSYLVVLSRHPSLGEGEPAAVEIHDRAEGAVFYAAHGAVEITNTVKLHTVYGHKVIIKDNSLIEYEEGLKNLLFSEGPTGSYGIDDWREAP